ncbi:hypothetical protein E4T85_20435 [Bacillus stratosphericus]|nr:hypothetical protein E4T99_01420 [Neisseria sp. WF04]TFV04847.1 hypothetical protein E4T85_20435 [Bacillus stratosphericus]
MKHILNLSKFFAGAVQYYGCEVVNKPIYIAANKMGGLTRVEWNEAATNPTAQSRNALSSSHKIRQEVPNYYKF